VRLVALSVTVYIHTYVYGVRAALRSFLVDLFVPKIKLRERERERMYVCIKLRSMWSSSRADSHLH
jgi:hypothetical protein